MKEDILTMILIMAGATLIMVGILVAVADDYKREICTNTKDIIWYYNNCMEVK